MEPILNYTDVLINSLSTLGENLMTALPAVIAALLIITLGWALAKIMKWLLTKFLRKIRFDKIFIKINLTQDLEKVGLKSTPSKIIGKFAYWIILLLFIIAASDTIGWSFVSTSINELLIYLPKLFVAIILFVIGIYLADIVRDVLKGLFAAAHIKLGELMGSVAYYLIIIIVSITALAQAGINTSLLTTNASIIIGGIVVAFAISFGLGAKDVMASLLSLYYMRSSLKVGNHIQWGNQKGEIVKIDRITISVRTDNGIVIIPVKKLSEENITILN